jgi:hypothetical protein
MDTNNDNANEGRLRAAAEEAAMREAQEQNLRAAERVHAAAEETAMRGPQSSS